MKNSARQTEVQKHESFVVSHYEDEQATRATGYHASCMTCRWQGTFTVSKVEAQKAAESHRNV